MSSPDITPGGGAQESQVYTIPGATPGLQRATLELSTDLAKETGVPEAVIIDPQTGDTTIIRGSKALEIGKYSGS